MLLSLVTQSIAATFHRLVQVDEAGVLHNGVGESLTSLHLSGSLNVQYDITASSIIADRIEVDTLAYNSVGTYTGSTSFGTDHEDTHVFTGSQFVTRDVNIGDDLRVGGTIFVGAGDDPVVMSSVTSSFVQYNTGTDDVTIAGTLTAEALVEVSTIDFKQSVADQDHQLERVLKLRPVDFEWKANGTRDKGFIAEEVEEIFPEFIFKDETGKTIGIKYAKLVSVLVQSIKDLHEEVVHHEKENLELKDLLHKYDERLKRLEQHSK